MIRKIMKNKTGRRLFCMSGLALAGTLILPTVSYFTQKEELVNVFTMGDLQIGLQESEWDPGEGDGKDICPGYTVYKNPTVKNRESEVSQPCYLQIRVIPQDEQGMPITDENRLKLIREMIRYDRTYNGGWDKQGAAELLIQGRIPGYTREEIGELPMVNPAFEETDSWCFAYTGGDGGILDPGEETVLFTHLAVPAEWTREEMQTAGSFELAICAQAIQASGFPDREEALARLSEQAEKAQEDAGMQLDAGMQQKDAETQKNEGAQQQDAGTQKASGMQQAGKETK